jgi:hypothetical protein
MKSPIATASGTVLCVLAASLVPAAGAEIFKCVGAGVTAYQSMPCAQGAAETRLPPTGGPSPRVVETQAPALPAPPTREPLRRAGPWNHTTLTLGMSDDEVLNLPGWGRPSRIIRVKAPHEWREEWVYGPATAGERHLHFANAKLVDINVTPPADRLAQLAPQ